MKTDIARGGFHLAIGAVAVLGALAPARAATESVPPLPDPPGASVSRATSETSLRAAPRRPLRTPVSAARYAAIKAAAVYGSAAPVAGPTASAQAGPAPALANIQQSFVGLDRPGAASHGFVFFPPDTNVAKSALHVLEATNSALRLFNTLGGIVATSDLNTFFGAPVGSPATAELLLFDPKVFFDVNAANRRFYVVALQQTAAPKLSKIWLAVSRTADPANLLPTSWCRYSIDARRNVGTADESWADYPGLGVGADKLVVSVNNFRFAGAGDFTFAIVRAFNKLIASNNAAACHSIPSFTFQATSVIGSGSVFTLQPVQHYSSPSSVTSPVGTTSPAYLVNTEFGASTVYHVWRIAGLPGVTNGVLQPVNVTGLFTYDVPPSAPQTGTTVRIDTGDDRVTQAAGRGSYLTAVHGTLCNVGGGANESCVRMARIFVSSSGTNPTAAMSQQSTFGSANEFYFWPGVAVNNVFQTIVPFQFVSPARTGGRLSIWFSTKDLPTPFFTSILPLSTGSCPQVLSDRSGDFTGAQVDPSDIRTFWIAGERATAVAGECQWQTQIGHVDPGFGTSGF